jgi:uncharacterized protein YprB with RNaseH-like and TPR domain
MGRELPTADSLWRLLAVKSRQVKVNHSVSDRFVRLKALQQRATALPGLGREMASAGRCAELDSPPLLGRERLASILGASVKTNLHGEHLLLETRYDNHAPWPLDVSAVRLLAPNAPENVTDAGRWLFLDTETTGLSGGTGTYPFLVGLAWFEGKVVKVEQLFMREYSEERSLLATLAERLAERPVLVTFNGKSFDWPLLETRYRMTRTMSPPVPRAHLDFLHPARNLWRLRLGSLRLSGLERHVLGWDRGADIASELIPKLYLDFVRHGQADALVPVFHHNQMDLRGLAALAGRVISLLAEGESISQDGLELFGVSRICERRGEAKRARKLYEQSMSYELPIATHRLAQSALARLAKRDGDMVRALELWESSLGNSREGYEAYEQLAIYYEHQAQDLRQALAVSREALAQLGRTNRPGTISAAAYRRNKRGFERRIIRLERKAQQTILEMLGAQPEAGSSS